MKRFLPFIIAGIIILLLVSIALVFFLGRKKEPGPIVLHYLGLWDPEVINPLKVAYQKNNPNTIIEYEQKDPSSYFSFLNKSLQNHNGPDIFWSHSGWEPVLAPYLASVPSTVYTSAQFEKAFYPLVKETGKLGGLYRGIPLEIDGLALIYNKDLLAAKGFSPPKDLDSLINMSSVLTSKDNRGKITVAGVALGSSKNVDNFSEILGLLMLQNKVTFIKNKVNLIASNLSLDGRNLSADALSVYIKFASTFKVWDSTLPPSTEAFSEGKVAMLFLPASSLSSLQAQIKEKNIKVNFAVAPVPQVIKSDPVSWGSYWNNAVNASSKNQVEAWKFLKFLSQPDSLRKLFANEVQNRGVGRAYPRIEMAKELNADPLLGAYVQQAPFAKSWYMNSNTGENLLNDPIVASLGKWVDLNANASDSFAAAVSWAKEIEPVLEKYALTTNLATPIAPTN